MKKPVLALVLVCATVFLLLTACGGGVKAGSGGDIRAWVASTPETIDPQKNSSSDGGTYLTHLCQGLYRYKWDGTGVELGDAKSVDVSSDGLTWTFHLRGDIKWSDGKDVTAYDYEYAWRRLCDPDTASPYAEDMGGFLYNGLAVIDGQVPVEELGVKAVDDKTFEVKLAGPCAFFDQVAVFATFDPVRKDIIEANGDGWWHSPDTFVGNGPFKMKEFALEQKIVMVPNEYYYDKAKVVPASVTFLFLEDDDTAYAAFRSGEVDIVNSVPLPEIESLKADGLFNLRDLLGTYYIDFNLDNPIFSNVNVRKALTLAIDRKYICDTVNFGTRVPATSFVGGGFPDIKGGDDFRTVGGIYISEDYEANKAAAVQALADAGYPGGAGFPVLEYLYNTSSGHKAIAEAIAHDWETVLGIKVNLANQDWNVFLDTRRHGDYDIARDGWLADFNDASTMLNLQMSNSGNNNANYHSAAFDQYMSEAMQATDRASYIAKLHSAEKTMMDDWAVCPIFFYKQSYAVSKDLKDWHEIPLGYTLLQLAHK